MSAPVHWTQIPEGIASRVPEDILTSGDIVMPLTSEGERCIWPWEPQQLVNVPMGMYHCLYCGEMVVAGIPHTDYSALGVEGMEGVDSA